MTKKLLEMSEKIFYNKPRVTLERLGIRPPTPHCCRYTFYSLMAKSGIQSGIIKGMGGHEGYSTTMLCTHIQLDEKLEAVNKL